MSTTLRRFSSRMGEPTSLHHRSRPSACLLLTVVAAAGLRVYRLACAPTSTNDVEIGAPIAVRVDEKEHIDAFKDFTAPTDGATPAPAAAAPATSAGAAPAAATPNPVAAAAPAASVAGVSMPAVGGRIYWNEAKGWFRA